jgi:hypothetical protein
MNEIDILKKLASNLTERKSVAALSNYEVLCNNISFSHGLLGKGLSYLSYIVYELKSMLGNNDSLRSEYQNGKHLFPFTSIVPSLLSNDLEVINKLYLLTGPDVRDNIDESNVEELHKGFIEYNTLVTATRQLIDSLVTDSYQMQLLDPKEFNYNVLLSLNSFEKYATKSIRKGLFNDEVEAALSEFRRLNFRDWRNSPITKCQHPTFANKVDFLFSEMNRTTPNDDSFKEEVKNLFKFSSEFTHIGYIFTFFTSESGSQPIFGGKKSPYLPSTENFSELKYQILETCITFIFKIYIPSIKLCINKMVFEDAASSITKYLDNIVNMLEHGIKTRNNNYYFFVCSSLIGSQETIELPCQCGYINKWKPPHNNSDLFCIGCGSSYNIMAVEGDPSYIITSNGPVKVIGSSAPDFQDLPFEKQQELMQKVAECKEESNCN